MRNDSDYDGNEHSLIQAIKEKNYEKVDSLLKSNKCDIYELIEDESWYTTDFDTTDRTILCFASLFGTTKIMIRLLQDKNFKINEFSINHYYLLDNKPGCYYYGKQISTKMLNYLLSHDDIKIDKNRYIAVEIAIKKGLTKAFNKLLLNKKIKLKHTNEYLQNFLHIATKAGQKGIVKTILPFCTTNITNNEIDINATDIGRMTPLGYAAEHNFIEITRLLLKNEDIDVNIQNGKSKRTALRIACFKGHISIVKQLLQNKSVDPNIPDKYGVTSLNIAIQEDQYEVIALLLNDPRTRIDFKNSVWLKAYLKNLAKTYKNIHQALSNKIHTLKLIKKTRSLICSKSSVSHLIKKGAHPNGVDHKGRNPLICALFNHHWHSAAALVDNGVPIDTPYINKHFKEEDIQKVKTIRKQQKSKNYPNLFKSLLKTKSVKVKKNKKSMISSAALIHMGTADKPRYVGDNVTPRHVGNNI